MQQNPPDLMTGMPVQGELAERYAKQYPPTAKGTVRLEGFWAVGMFFPLCVVLFLVLNVFFGISSPVMTVLLAAVLFGAALYLLYLLSWRLDFDAETGFVPLSDAVPQLCL